MTTTSTLMMPFFTAEEEAADTPSTSLQSIAAVAAAITASLDAELNLRASPTPKRDEITPKKKAKKVYSADGRVVA